LCWMQEMQTIKIPNGQIWILYRFIRLDLLIVAKQFLVTFFLCLIKQFQVFQEETF